MRPQRAASTPPGPTPALSGDGWDVYHADTIELAGELPANSVDAVITDPPYGLEFMGKAWDAFAPQDRANAERWNGHRLSSEGWEDAAKAASTDAVGGGPSYGNMTRQHLFRRCSTCGRREFSGTPCACDEPDWTYEAPPGAPSPMLAYEAWCQAWGTALMGVVKPGGWLVTFGGTRTVHRLTSGLENAGWEVRDLGLWLYRGGAPKARTHLKPAWEPWTVLRKPVEGSVAANVDRWGTGALNIDDARHPWEPGAAEKAERSAIAFRDSFGDGFTSDVYGSGRTHGSVDPAGRWPANLITDDPNRELWRPFTIGPEFLTDAPKAPAHERPRDGDESHPTVKPLTIMRHLVRLFVPPGGNVLDPFAGSGTTIEAAAIEGRQAIGVEKHAPYLRLIADRMAKPLAATLDFGS